MKSAHSNTRLAVAGRLLRSIDQIDQVLASGIKDLEIDFLQATFISVEGLEWLEELLLRADSVGAKITFVNVPPVLYKVFKVAHIDIISKACGSPNHMLPGTSGC